MQKASPLLFFWGFGGFVLFLHLKFYRILQMVNFLCLEFSLSEELIRKFIFYNWCRNTSILSLLGSDLTTWVIQSTWPFYLTSQIYRHKSVQNIFFLWIFTEVPILKLAICILFLDKEVITVLSIVLIFQSTSFFPFDLSNVCIPFFISLIFFKVNNSFH